jgi:hypothetical protein
MFKCKGYTFADIVSDELASMQPSTYQNRRSFVKPWSNCQQGTKQSPLKKAPYSKTLGDSFSSIVDGGYSDSDTSSEDDGIKSWQPCNFTKLNDKFSRLPLDSMQESNQNAQRKPVTSTGTSQIRANCYIKIF